MERTVMLTDTAKVGFLVDLDIEHLLRKKHIWTREDGTLILQVFSPYREGYEEIPLAVWIWETMMMQDLSSNAEIRFRDGNKRNLVFRNLEAKVKERSA